MKLSTAFAASIALYSPTVAVLPPAGFFHPKPETVGAENSALDGSQPDQGQGDGANWRDGVGALPPTGWWEPNPNSNSNADPLTLQVTLSNLSLRSLLPRLL